MAHRINVEVLRAKDLKREDGLLGKNDPYVVLTIGHRLLGGQKHKTATQKNQNGEVEFGESFTFDAKPSDELKVKVYDDDLISDDDIGYTKIPLDTLFESNQIKQWYQIGEGSKVRGQVELRLNVLRD
ncbi:Arf guanine nucleotide exchange factor syt1 [Podila horticola]|nr:Arf guanine nucleotide exchange factor syt1 [Podila horticola]KAG0339145.1 Arf guanine nucleotide exchange factor syt1 [Podila horticola]